MNQMEIFKNPEFGAIRAVEIDGEPWLVGKDVALALGYKNPQEAIRNHVDAEDKGVSEILTPGGTQKLPIINESGLYSLVLSSKLPQAKQFRRWITSEVLPSIRKHGAYVTQEKLWEVATSPEALLKLCSDLLAEREKNAALREDNARLQGKAVYYDLFIDLWHSTNLRTTAKELDVPERRFVRFLLERRYVYRTPSGCVLPYFYILIDRANEDKETAVHFLNQVDEADLEALMEDGETAEETPAVCNCTEKCAAGAVNTACPVCAVNMAECTGQEPDPTPAPETDPEPEQEPAETAEPEEEAGNSMGGLIVFLVVLLIGGGAALYFFKFKKPKADVKGSDDLDEYDFGEDEDDDEDEPAPEVDDDTGEVEARPLDDYLLDEDEPKKEDE